MVHISHYCDGVEKLDLSDLHELSFAAEVLKSTFTFACGGERKSKIVPSTAHTCVLAPSRRVYAWVGLNMVRLVLVVAE